MKTRKIACAAVVGLTVGIAYSDTYYRTSDDKYDGLIFTSGEAWGAESAPCAGNSYVVTNGPYVSTPNTSFTFGGDFLQLGVVGNTKKHAGNMLHRASGANTITYGRDGLRLAKGLYCTWLSGKRTLPIAGKVTVLSPSSDPFQIQAYKADISYDFLADFVSDSDRVLLLVGVVGREYMRFSGDMTQYRGTMQLTNNIAMLLGSSAMPGVVSVAPTCRFGALDAATTATVETLSFAAGSELYVPVDSTNKTVGVVNVIGTLSVDGPVGVRPTDYLCPTNGDVKVLVLKGPTGAFVKNDFVLVYGAAAVGALTPPAFGTLSVEDDGAHARLYLNLPGVVRQQVTSMGASGAGVPNNDSPDFWSDARTLHDGDYVVTRLDPSATTVFQVKDGWISAYTMPVSSLSLLGLGTQLKLAPEKITIGDLHLVDGAMVAASAKGTSTLYGDVFTYSNGGASDYWTTFVGFYNQSLSVRSTLSGDGQIKITGNTGSGSPVGSVELYGTNTSFTGRMWVTIDTSTLRGTPAMDKCEWLYLNDARNLGGPRPSYDYRALTIDQMCVVSPRCSMTLDDATRGVYVENIGRFNVPEDVTLTLNETVTYAGRLMKEGAGTLVLGRPAAFIDGASAPVAGTNVLEVVAGRLKVTHSRALDGVALTLDSGTTLVFDAAPADPDMAAKGIVNTWSTPVTVEGGGNVAIDVEIPGRGEFGYMVALFTLESTVATTLYGQMDVPEKPGYRMSKILRHNGDGTSTILAGYCKHATRIILR